MNEVAESLKVLFKLKEKTLNKCEHICYLENKRYFLFIYFDYGIYMSEHFMTCEIFDKSIYDYEFSTTIYFDSNDTNKLLFDAENYIIECNFYDNTMSILSEKIIESV